MSGNHKTNGNYRTGADLLPVDLGILELLPDEGQMIGYKPIALQVRAIKGRPGFEEFSAYEIAGRIRAMREVGFVVAQRVTPSNGGSGYQRTAKGREAWEKTGKVVVAA